MTDNLVDPEHPKIDPEIRVSEANTVHVFGSPQASPRWRRPRQAGASRGARGACRCFSYTADTRKNRLLLSIRKSSNLPACI